MNNESDGTNNYHWIHQEIRKQKKWRRKILEEYKQKYRDLLN